MAGSLPRRQRRLVEAWAELHQRELMDDSQRLQAGHSPLPIQPFESGGMEPRHAIYRLDSFRLVRPYTLRVRFDGETEQTIDFRPILEGEMHGPLRERAVRAGTHRPRGSHSSVAERRRLRPGDVARLARPTPRDESSRSAVEGTIEIGGKGAEGDGLSAFTRRCHCRHPRIAAFLVWDNAKETGGTIAPPVLRFASI